MAVRDFSLKTSTQRTPGSSATFCSDRPDCDTLLSLRNQAIEQGSGPRRGSTAMIKVRMLYSAGALAAVAFLAGCMSGGTGSPLGGQSGVEGEWMSTDGVAISRFSGGNFETVATDTGNKLAQGIYKMSDPRNVTITGQSVIQQSAIAFNCSLANATQLKCTNMSGQQFVLVRRPKATS